MRLNAEDTEKLKQAMALVREVMAPLDVGADECTCCGKKSAKNPEARALWEALNAANMRIAKVINWTPWEEGVGVS